MRAVNRHPLRLVDGSSIAVIDLVIVLHIKRDRSSVIELHRHARGGEALYPAERAVLHAKLAFVLQEHDSVARRPDRFKPKQSKASALAEDGALNPAPLKVGDPKFREESFFDPRDIVQVKYEMLRRVSVDKMSVTQVSDEYGVSRPTFYQAKTDFEGGGIAGLAPRKRGPRGPTKIQGEVLALLRANVAPGEPIRARELTNLVRSEFGLEVHPRTIERALGVKKTA